MLVCFASTSSNVVWSDSLLVGATCARTIHVSICIQDMCLTGMHSYIFPCGFPLHIARHCGARSEANLPVNRGFDFHLGFLKGGEDHFHQNRCAGGPNAAVVDLWSQVWIVFLSFC